MSQSNDIIKRNEIKHAAKKLFFRFGLSKTSMEDIARQCGLAKASLYYYYPSKEAIFNEIVIEEARLLMDTVESQLPVNLAADAKIAEFYRLIYEKLKPYVREMDHVPDFMCESSPHGRPIIEKINELFISKLHPLLHEGKLQGIFEFENEKVTMLALTFMAEFLNFEWMRRYPEEVRDAAIEAMIQILLNGLKRRHK